MTAITHYCRRCKKELKEMVISKIRHWKTNRVVATAKSFRCKNCGLTTHREGKAELRVNMYDSCL